MNAPRRPTLVLFTAALLTLGACRVAAPGPTPTGPMAAERPPLLDAPPLAARCEPARCEAFCDSASCLFADRKTCLVLCRERCGDAYFEPADQELVSCVEAQPGCEPAKTCCARHFTSQLCAE